MSATSDRRSRARQAFTLVELMVALSLSTIVFAGILAAYLFVGRSLTRLINLQHQEVESRRTLKYFSQDLSEAIQLTTATSSQVTLTKPAAGGTTTTVSYVYSAGDGTFVRTDATGSQTLLAGLTALTITYYNEGGTAISGSPQSVKSAELSYSSTSGSALSGTQVRYVSVSPRVVLRNKPLLE